ncbi:TIGR04157 family glycosyltransferase [Parabacteroides goldsteinii]|uniref:TIGR04157 family glycosyltransferase n=1 Tax=Parabacteroides goldsteinii TaxID=328812 RepID=UPI0032B1120B
MKKHVYIFDESSRASTYGIGTYIRQMIVCLTDVSELTVHVVHIGADVEHFEIKEMQGYDLYNIPQYCIPMEGKANFYQRNIYYLIRLNCNYPKSDKFIFMFNYSNHIFLINLLKEWLPDSCFYFVIHYQNWCFSLNGNVVHFKQIIHSNDISTLSSSEQKVYNSFLKEKELYQVVDRVICLSRFTFSLLDEEYGISRNKLILIYNGLKDEKKILPAEGRKLLKKRYHFSSKEKVILFVGRLDTVKGIEMLIMSSQDLLQRNENCRLVVVGEGDFSYYLARCGTCWNKITFTGYLSKEQLYDFYQIADIGVMPSMHEQCSYVAIEMMMFALPLVVSSTSGLKEMVRDGDFGYTFDMENDSEKSKNELVDLITKILEEPWWKREKMKSLSRSSYEEKYLLQDMQKRYLDLILSEQ